MASQLSSLSEPKAVLRRAALIRRREIHQKSAASAGAKLADRLCGEIDKAYKIIAGYWPIGDEIDCRPALERLAANGHHIVLPVVAGQGEVLLFRTWNPGDQLETGPFGTSHPGRRASVHTPDLLLLPLVAFDQVGHRLGYGAGYYDRTLAALHRDGGALAIGVGYDEQEIERIPADNHDQIMDAVMTDQRTLWFNKAGSGQQD